MERPHLDSQTSAFCLPANDGNHSAEALREDDSNPITPVGVISVKSSSSFHRKVIHIISEMSAVVEIHSMDDLFSIEEH